MTPFFITGLPRSGTAWLSNLFSPGKTLCFHEPKPSDVVAAINAHAGRRVGAAGAELVKRYATITQCWPDARWLYVVRPIEDVFVSLAQALNKAGIDINRASLLKELEADRIRGHALLNDTGRVAGAQFHDLMTDVEVMAQAWHWLVPEVKFDRARWEVLRRLNVQQDFKARISENMRQTLSALTAPPAQQTTN